MDGASRSDGSLRSLPTRWAGPWGVFSVGVTCCHMLTDAWSAHRDTSNDQNQKNKNCIHQHSPDINLSPLALTAPQHRHQPTPGARLLIALAYGSPKPSTWPPQWAAQTPYQVLLCRLKLLVSLQLAKAYVYDPKPFTAALQALQ